jgi:hypothetical protein
MRDDCLSVVVEDTGDPFGVAVPVLKLALRTRLGLASPGCICSMVEDGVSCWGEVGIAPYVKGLLFCRAW